MNSDEKTNKLEGTQNIYNKLLSRISQLCEEAETELKQLNKAG